MKCKDGKKHANKRYKQINASAEKIHKINCWDKTESQRDFFFNFIIESFIQYFVIELTELTY